MNLYKILDSLANPANSILSTMEKMNALADVANTKATAAAQSPMPPPPPTPGTSGKKRKRSAASLARDKLVSSKKYQTYKLYEALQSSGIINDPSELGKLQEHLTKMVRPEAERRADFEKELRDELWKKRDEAKEQWEIAERHRKHYFDKETERRLEREQIKFSLERALRASADAKNWYMEEKVQLMEDREELEEKIQEQSQWKEKYEKVQAEVKELRKLKYAADRKAKGPVGVVR